LEHELSYLKSLSATHDIIGNSDMKIAPLRGRPFGGRAFISDSILKVYFIIKKTQNNK
jgi:hypothetical protein